MIYLRKTLIPYCLFFALIFILGTLIEAEAGISPDTWPEEKRASVERDELVLIPAKSKIVTSNKAMISATVSPISIEAGLQTLHAGGTAADAAIVVALTQIATCGGSVVSYAGIADVLYYDAKSKRTHNLHAPWKSYRDETDPESIPLKKNLTGKQGRKTLVPGFMAAMDELHGRFGVLPWKELFQPAIHYTEKGVKTPGLLAFSMKTRESVIGRTEAGREFLQPDGSPIPSKGERFYQPETAITLRKIAEHGAKYMYEGEWAEQYVSKVRSEGGLVTLEDLKGYKVFWQTPLTTEFEGYTVKASGMQAHGGHQLLLGLNLDAQLGLPHFEPYWKSPESFYRLSLVSDFIEMDPEVLLERANSKGANFDLSDRSTKDFAKQVVESVQPDHLHLLQENSEHTDAIVVVDEWGNIAAITHTINTGLWGSSGIVVGGIPIADSASGFVARKRKIEPGEYLPLGVSPAIVFRGEEPKFAIAGIGAVSRELNRILLSYLGQKQDMPTILEAPKWLFRIGSRKGDLAIVEGKYSEEFIAELEKYEMRIALVSPQKGMNLEGKAAFVEIPEGNNVRELNSYVSSKGMTYADGY